LVRNTTKSKKRRSARTCPHCGQILPAKAQLPIDEDIELTPRLKEVLVGVANGKMNSDIARELGISVRTVEFHRKLLMERLRLKNTAALTLYASKEGLI
jgi:DNA-binding NarL/FixJ family response regulator